MESVTVSVSDDLQEWEEVAVIKNEKLGTGSFEESAIDLSAPVKEKARYLKLFVKKSKNVERILLGEIVLEQEGATVESSERPRIPPTPMQVKRVLD